MAEENPSLTRLNKAIGDTGYCSRREADKLVEQGRVTVNGEKGVLGMKISDTDELRVDGKIIKSPSKRIYIAFNKPVGIICTTERNVANNIIDFINHPERIFPIGRLDKPSEGLILLTTDGDIVNKILRAGNNHEKEYVVTTDMSITDDFIYKMSNGIPILDTVTLKCEVKKVSSHVFNIKLKQGLNRQIRRMCKYLGYDVIKLKRIRIMNITLDNIPVGGWRNLTTDELDYIMTLISSSSKTEEASYIESKDDELE